MKWAVYNLLFAVAYLIMLPSFLLRMKRRGGYRARMGDRFARYPFAMPKGRVWIHAVSVGEAQVAGQFMRALREIDPKLEFVFSTTSSTGWKIAEREITSRDILIYNPLDFPWLVKRAMDAIAPRAVILAETEIWPNFIREIRRRNIPLFLVNARISDRSAPRYRAMRWFFGESFRSFTRIFAQSETDAARLIAAGADKASITVTGSTKFDVAKRNPAKEAEMRDWIGAGRILLGGSTWPGEDEAMLRTYAALRKEAFGQDVKLVIAPRHFEKADAIEANIVRAGYRCVRRSRGDAAVDGAVYLADTTGELMGLYGIADVVFVGKSLYAHGSQNMIEPCLCGAVTFVGPHTENFRPVMSDLLEAGGICVVQDESELQAEVLRAMNPADDKYCHLGERAKAAVERRRGTTASCAGIISSSL